MTTNSGNFLHKAGLLIKGEIADATSTIKENQEARNKAMWQAVCNLFCHAAVNVFGAGYSKVAAAQFKTEVATNCGITEKQASKYTETISAAMKMRGTRKGIKSIPGLFEAAQEGPGQVEKLFSEMAEPVNTLGGLTRLIREPGDPLRKLAEKLSNLDGTDREAVEKMVKKMDELAEKAKAAADRKATKVNGAAAQATV